MLVIKKTFWFKRLLLETYRVRQCTAEDIYQSITKLLFGDTRAPKANLVGFVADSFSCMIEEQSGMQAGEAIKRLLKFISHWSLLPLKSKVSW